MLFALLFAFAVMDVCGTVHVRENRWRWSNPVPHGNNVLDMFVTPDVAMQVGDAGSIHVRGADARWAPCESGVTNYLRGAALMGNRLLAVGENGCIRWSEDWQRFHSAQLDQGTSDWFEGVAASSQRAVAVGDNGTIYFSNDVTNWTRAVSGTAEWLRGVACSSQAFVAVGEHGQILRSANGNAWTSIPSETTEHLNRIRFLGSGTNARFIAVGNHGVMLSSQTGLAPWTQHATGTTNNLYDVALNDSGLLLVGDQEIRFQAVGESNWSDQISGLPSNAPPAWVYISAARDQDRWLVAGRSGLLMEGTVSKGLDYTWNTFEHSSHAWIWDMTVQKGICVAVGDLASIQTSLDGILWAGEAVPDSYSNAVFLGVGGTSNLLVAVGSDGSVLSSHAGQTTVTVTNEVGGQSIVTNISVEALGVVWTPVPAFTTNTLQGVAASEGLLLVCGNNGNMFASTNGADWQVRPTPTDDFLSGVAIGPTACVAVGANGTVLRAAQDGTGWYGVPLEIDDWIYRVRWIDGLFVAVGENGGIFTSPDGLAWTPRVSGTSRWLTDVTRVEDHWFVTGYQGTLLNSQDLVSWNSLPVPTVKSLFTACQRNGGLMVAGIEGVILRNQVVPIESSVDLLAYTPSVVTYPDSSEVLYEVFLLGGVPDQFFTLQSSTNMNEASWAPLGEFELFDPSGTLYLLRSGNLSNAEQTEYYRTKLVP